MRFILSALSLQEEVRIDNETMVSFLKPNSSFGEISILCNIPQPYTVRVHELSRLLRIDKQSFSNILEIYFHDGRKVLTNLLPLLEVMHCCLHTEFHHLESFSQTKNLTLSQGKQSNLHLKQLESDVTIHISKQEAELALRVNSAAYYGDLHQLKSLIRSGADPKKKDYDGKTALVQRINKLFKSIVYHVFMLGIQVIRNCGINNGFF